MQSPGISDYGQGWGGKNWTRGDFGEIFWSLARSAYSLLLVVPAAMAAAMTVATAAPISGEGAFMASIMAGIAGVALSVPCLIPVEMVEWLVAAFGQRTMVTIVGIVPVIDMAQETVPAVEPWASSDKYPVRIPVGPIVTVGSAIVGRIVEVSVRTPGGSPNIYADGNLGLGYLRTAQQRNGKQCESKSFSERHRFSLMHCFT